ncbi:putative Siroheme synthase [Leptospirillum ferrooxidans C2-3]|uniref:precorrin-2 dehydrogenase n=1 Tax=Leptospirillum ferrooxidans (strain C2-3) TaxID=1162668 RepID=I0IKH0_LEPFC|nr:putative Siroheme synthase [Leptospirillum ferrooxidans C2-3]
MLSLFPVALELSDRPVLIVGAGKVAERKILKLMDCGARVRVISPLASALIEHWASLGQIEWIQRSYHSGDEGGYCLVWAVTDDHGLNGEIARNVREAGGFCDTATASSDRSMRSLAQGNVGSLMIAATSNPSDPIFSRMMVREILTSLKAEGLDSISIEHGCLREALLLQKMSSEELVRNMSKVGLVFFRENTDFSDRLALYVQWFGQEVSDRVRSCVLKRSEGS